MEQFSKSELSIFKKLSTPAGIQDFLDAIPINFEEHGDTCMSPRRVLETKKAHCMEGAMFAAAALRMHGHPPLVLDLKTSLYADDVDHVVAPFRVRGRWGAISKTNHPVLRYRDPIYQSIRELVLSYFHEYFMDSGKKTLRSYSLPLDLSRFDKKHWILDTKDIFYIPEYLDSTRHISILTPTMQRMLRPASKLEIEATKMTEWAMPRRHRSHQ